ncbi:MAG: hemerythrin domain-containing protein [Actinomycetota bacterium]
MPKRDPNLVPLTHDHHHALVHARRLIEAADAGPTSLMDEARSFLSFYENDTLLHFHEEEEVLFPRFLDAIEEPPPELTQVLIEHVRIHGLVTRLRDSLGEGEPDAAIMKLLGEMLRAHVRLEENKLFPLIEEHVAQAQLDSLEFAERQRG